jgi:hypothetical protein
MVFRCLIVLLSLLVLPIISVSSHAQCLTTLPSNPPFVPPAPYPTDASDGFWYGSDALWTKLPFHGDWATAGKMGQKLFVWSRGYDWRTARQPQLIVTGKRLDGDAPPIAVAGGTNAGIGGTYAMLTMVRFPTGGCWELTSYHEGHALTFVVSVANGE